MMNKKLLLILFSLWGCVACSTLVDKPYIIPFENFQTLRYYESPDANEVIVEFWDGNSAITITDVTISTPKTVGNDIVLLSLLGAVLDERDWHQIDKKIERVSNGNFIVRIPVSEKSNINLRYKDAFGVHEITYEGLLESPFKSYVVEDIGDPFER